MIESAVTEVVVERVLSQLDKGCIFAGRQRNGSAVRIRVSGQRLAPVVGESYEVQGLQSTFSDRFKQSWTQIDTRTIKRVRTSGALLRPWLEQLPNIGEKRASRLFDTFGDGLIAALSDPGQLSAVAAVIDPKKPGLANAIAAQILAAVGRKNKQETTALEEVEFLASLESAGVRDRHAARRLWRLVGGVEAKARLLRNPYLAASVIDWKAADHLGKRLLAKRTDDIDSHPDRLLGAIDSCWREVLSDGDTAASPSTLTGLLTDRGVDAGRAIDLAHQKHALLPGANGLYRAPGAAFLEDDLAAMLRRLEAAPAAVVTTQPAVIVRAVVDAETKTGLYLTDEQREAVIALLTRRVGVLQGGGGVGKTFVMKVLVLAWESLGGNVVLGALAGKAALQLSRGASTGSHPRLAYTVARMVGMLRRDQDGDPNVEVQFNERTLLVLDEASMLDTPSLRELVSFLPEGAGLMLVGDHGQLPPVGIGCVFHDLVSDGSRVSSLTKVWRQASGSPILEASAAVRNGITPELGAWDGSSVGIFLAPGSDAALLHNQFMTRSTDLMVVAARRATVAAFNERASLSRREGVTRVARLGPLATVAVGDPVVCTRNRYTDSLFNGLLGRVVDIDHLGDVHVHWD
ncbi:MAG: AAA family ATPase, partial [Burkholderiaceae bacterium]|nr:AAA family ATPase [Burkholderiaceae bacterium]